MKPLRHTGRYCDLVGRLVDAQPIIRYRDTGYEKVVQINVLRAENPHRQVLALRACAPVVEGPRGD